MIKHLTAVHFFFRHTPPQAFSSSSNGLEGIDLVHHPGKVGEEPTPHISHHLLPLYRPLGRARRNRYLIVVLIQCDIDVWSTTVSQQMVTFLQEKLQCHNTSQTRVQQLTICLCHSMRRLSMSSCVKRSALLQNETQPMCRQPPQMLSKLSQRFILIKKRRSNRANLMQQSSLASFCKVIIDSNYH